ncbi:type II toxin-antitoxin system ParD family antitoxin [Mesorhizobium sp. M7D.F.Ca.US.005.01.1.1]|uniref:type II toxin-antitoxin system ParD family antitoxin n=1 Tax=Mesorhizobium sp. M7D.F.Ca.US.005.01.1.1 TaxID=2493678 RepID=UPI000F75E352|nr:type II toxin-antitoxin system ParD family antitoxin [Mesorhizobium sp. M7D.F.Ca.US.005.01.1.1]AZO42308.1 type II toxin-antitoxin system ParD family antitoxin [Mesorhizobium sp. M7D.F.Ca.US.005.01.1.1]
MRTTQQMSITLPPEMAQMVKTKVASGEYATESEVIRDGLRALAARDKALERWLVEEVVPTLKDFDAHPENLGDPEDVRGRLKARVSALTAKSSRSA